MKRLEGKVALVTGAGRGLGRVIALRLAEEGATLVVNYANSRAGAHEVVDTIAKQGGKAVAIQADVSKRSEVQAMFREIDRDPGSIDIVVNSSAVVASGALADLDEDELETLLGVNLRGPLYVASEASKRLPEGGRIVNISSSVAKFPHAGSGVYSATKCALESFTESWAKELGQRGITVNTVIPGATSPGMADASPEYHDFFASASPFQRIGRGDEIAAVVAFLCSPESSWVSGTRIMANGGANA